MGPRSETKINTVQGVPLNDKTEDTCTLEAIAAWNTRADLPATDEQAFANPKVKSLVDALSGVIDSFDNRMINMDAAQEVARAALAAMEPKA